MLSIKEDSGLVSNTILINDAVGIRTSIEDNYGNKEDSKGNLIIGIKYRAYLLKELEKGNKFNIKIDNLPSVIETTISKDSTSYGWNFCNTIMQEYLISNFNIPRENIVIK